MFNLETKFLKEIFTEEKVQSTQLSALLYLEISFRIHKIRLIKTRDKWKALISAYKIRVETIHTKERSL